MSGIALLLVLVTLAFAAFAMFSDLGPKIAGAVKPLDETRRAKDQLRLRPSDTGFRQYFLRLRLRRS